MKWTAKQVDRLILEMADQAKSASWDDRYASDRARVLTEIMKHYGWVRRSQHPPEVCNAAVGIAFHAPSHGTEGHVLRLQVLGCLFAESHCETTLNPSSDQASRQRWFGLKSKHNPIRPHPDLLPNSRVVREQFARLLDKVLDELGKATVFGTNRPKFCKGRVIYPDLCCPNDLLWMRCSLGTLPPDSSVQPL